MSTTAESNTTSEQSSETVSDNLTIGKESVPAVSKPSTTKKAKRAVKKKNRVSATIFKPAVKKTIKSIKEMYKYENNVFEYSKDLLVSLQKDLVDSIVDKMFRTIALTSKKTLSVELLRICVLTTVRDSHFAKKMLEAGDKAVKEAQTYTPKKVEGKVVKRTTTGDKAKISVQPSSISKIISERNVSGYQVARLMPIALAGQIEYILKENLKKAFENANMGNGSNTTINVKNILYGNLERLYGSQWDSDTYICGIGAFKEGKLYITKSSKRKRKRRKRKVATKDVETDESIKDVEETESTKDVEETETTKDVEEAESTKDVEEAESTKDVEETYDEVVEDDDVEEEGEEEGEDFEEE